MRHQVSAGVSRGLTPLARFRQQPASFTCPASGTDSWIKPFRRQIAETWGASWYVLNNRGRIRLAVSDAGTVSLPFEWTARGSALALPRIQQIFKRWNDGQITLAAAAQNSDTSSTHQKLEFSQVIETYRGFVPNAGDKTWEGFYLPVLRNCAKAFEGRPPVDGEALAMHWPNGNRAQGCARCAGRSSTAS